MSRSQQLGRTMIISPLPIIADILLLFVAAVMGDRAQGILDGWKHWSGQNNAAVMSVLFLVFSVVLISQGIQGL